MKYFTFQNKKQKNYFEGWYHRFTDTDGNNNYALIFAMTKDKDNPHSFIQFFNGVENTSAYYTYDIHDFRFDKVNNTVYIKDNYISPHETHFSDDKVSITVQNTMQRELQLYGKTNSAMSYLQNAPLECFQEVVFIDAECTFTINETQYKGKSYMEKTYGTNFPKKWVWCQSNYSKNGSDLSFSVGLIPVLFFRVKGFFLILHVHGKEYRFASYNMAKVRVDKLSASQNRITVKKGKLQVVLEATSHAPVTLVGPSKNGVMDLDVFESITSTATLKLYEKGKLIFEDEYSNVGLELMY